MSVVIRNRKQPSSFSNIKRAPRDVVRREIKAQPGRHLEPGSRDARLQEIEDQLLARVIDTHDNRDCALDRLLHDALDATHAITSQRVLPLKGDACISRRIHQIEDLLLAAVVDNHPNRERALDRLMEDIEGPASDALRWDNDWDGLG